MLTKRILALGLFSVLIFTGCSQQATTESTNEDAAMMEAEPGEAMTEADGEEKMMAGEEIVIDTSNFKFSETALTAAPGETLTIKLTNSQGTHDLVIDELEVQSEVIEAGEETTVTITIPEDAEAGTEYSYYCSIGNHRQMGMEGTLTVK